VSTDDPRGGDAWRPNVGAGREAAPATPSIPGTPTNGPRHAATRGTRRQRRRARIRARKHWKLRRALLIVGLAVVLVIGAAGGYVLYLNAQVHRIAVRHLKPPPTKGPDLGTENILMVRSTSRCALTVQNPAYGLCSQGVTGVNSDVIMILHLNPAKKTVSVLSIPRDLFVPNARADGRWLASPPSPRRPSHSHPATPAPARPLVGRGREFEGLRTDSMSLWTAPVAYDDSIAYMSTWCMGRANRVQQPAKG
jgi:hypothetical protein